MRNMCDYVITEDEFYDIMAFQDYPDIGKRIENAIQERFSADPYVLLPVWIMFEMNRESNKVQVNVHVLRENTNKLFSQLFDVDIEKDTVVIACEIYDANTYPFDIDQTMLDADLEEDVRNEYFWDLCKDIHKLICTRGNSHNGIFMLYTEHKDPNA